jgi:putative ABC transport system permease protein
MLGSTFTAFYRSFTRHPLYALLNLIGLSFGIAVFITLGLFFRYETTYERWLPNSDRLYVGEVHWTMNGTNTTPSPASSGGLLEDLKADYQVRGTRILDRQATVHMGAQTTNEAAERVDPEFFSVTGLGLIAGDPATALSAPDKVVLTRAMADKYFLGNAPQAILGKVISLTDDQGTNNYRISGVMETPPDNTDIPLKFVRLLTPAYTSTIDNWHNYGSQKLVTLILSDPASVDHLTPLMPAFVDRHAAKDFAPFVPHVIHHLSFYPLRGVHLQDPKTRTNVFALGIVGVLAFLIAAINYVNLSTARAGMRAREVAVRKTLGATQGMLRTQFLCEALLTTVIAALIGLSLVELCLPLINAAGGLSLKLDYVAEGLPLALAAVFILLAGLLAGLYPAFVLAGFKPAQVLASSRTPAGGRWAVRTREALVVVQFTVVVAFLIMITGFFSQLQHMKTADIGFRRDGVLVSPSTYDPALHNGQRDAIWSAFRATPGVVSVTAGWTAPGDDYESDATTIVPDGYKGPTKAISWTIIGPDYFSTYGARLIAGRWLDPARGDDQYYQRDATGKRVLAGAGEVRNAIINRKAVTLLGYASPQAAVGRTATFDQTRHIRIVGVIEDMRFHSPKTPLPATLYFFDPKPYDSPVTGIRYAGVPEAVMRARLADAWRSVAPEVPFKVISAADNLDGYYASDRNRSNLFSIGALIAALIGCIGLYGMAAFNTSRRSREIGLRKVLGASSGQVTGLLIGQFLRPVVLANIIAWPLAWFALRQWLSQFEDPIAISPLYFLAATAVAILIALVTVGGLALINARAEPGKALRHD